MVSAEMCLSVSQAPQGTSGDTHNFTFYFRDATLDEGPAEQLNPLLPEDEVEFSAESWD